MPRFLSTTGDRLHDLELDEILRRITNVETASGSVVTPASGPIAQTAPAVIAAGVRSLAAAGQAPLMGDLVVAGGGNVTVTEQNFTLIVSVPNATGVAPGAVQLAGDLTGSATLPALAATGVSPGSYGDASHVPQIVVDAKGRITSAANVTVSGGGGGGLANIGIGGSGALQVAPGYQIPPGNAAFVPAYLLSDYAAGDAATGYIGSGAGGAITKPADTTNLSAGFLLNEGTGTTTTNQAGGSGALNSATWGTDTTGTSLTFGYSGSVNCGTGCVTGQGDFSVEVYGYYPGGTSGSYNTFASQNPSSGLQSAFALDVPPTLGAVTDPFRFFISDTADNVVSISTLAQKTAGNYHVVGTYQSSTKTLTLYVNGVSIGSVALSNPRKSSTGQNAFLGNGSYQGLQNGNNFTGKLYFGRFYNGYVMPGSEAGSRFSALQAPVLCALLDIGAFGYAPITTVNWTVGYANTLTEALEYGSDGVSWTPVASLGTPGSNSGTFGSSSRTKTISATTARYWRYSCKDSGGTNQLRLTDLRFS